MKVSDKDKELSGCSFSRKIKLLLNMILCSRRIAKMNIEVEEKNPKLLFLYVQLHWHYKLIAAKSNGYSVSGHMQIRCNWNLLSAF